jgi:HSP20 family protein
MTLITPTHRSVSYPVSPLASLLSLTRDFDRLFETAAQARDTQVAFVPSVELRENVDRVQVILELPGVDRGAVSVTFHDGVLTIGGERKAEAPAEGEVVRSERSYGRFERQVNVAYPVDSSKIVAGYKDGILTVTLPKGPEARPKTIDVAAN